MGYLSYWDWKYERNEFWHTNPLKDSFLKDVKAVIKDYKEMLKDLTISSEKIIFNGQEGYGCETFVFFDDGGSHSIKTGRLFSADGYDIVVSSILIRQMTMLEKRELQLMGRYRSKNENQYTKLVKEGFGQGTKENYKPWLTVRDVPSEGLSSRIPGWTTGRIHHFLSLRPNKHEFKATDYDLPILANNNPLVEIDIEHYKAVAEAVYWLLNNEAPILGLEELHKRYVSHLEKMNLTAAATKQIRQKDLIKEFTSFYGKDFLSNLNCTVDYSDDNWLSKLVRKYRSTSHPIRHILLMRFIGLTPEEFFNDKQVYHPFGQGPWICLNAAAEHYRKPVINECKVTRDYKLGVPVGTFSCPCGFVYSRRGPDKDKSDRFKRGRIKEFGQIWMSKLNELKDKKGLREMARILDVDPGTIKNQLNRLEQNDNIQVPNDSSENERNCYRSAWSEAVKLNKGKTKTEIRKLAQAEYIWLYRNDCEWLEKNSPEPLKRKKYRDDRVNWYRRDAELVEKINVVVNEELRNRSKKPKRLTISLIGKKIGELSLLQKHLNKLPKTEKVLGKVTESVEDYQIRRVKYVAQQIREREELVREWMIVREAGLRPGYSIRVQFAIEAEIEREIVHLSNNI